MGGSSSEDDLLDSLGSVLLGAGLVPLLPNSLDLLLGVRLRVGVLVCTEDLTNAGLHMGSLKVVKIKAKWVHSQSDHTSNIW